MSVLELIERDYFLGTVVPLLDSYKALVLAGKSEPELLERAGEILQAITQDIGDDPSVTDWLEDQYAQIKMRNTPPAVGGVH